MAKHLHCLTEWQGSSGNWYCADIEDLGGQYCHWMVTVRMLDISPADYVEMLVKEYNAIVSYHRANEFLSFYWKKQSDMRKYKNYINKIARDKKFYIG